MTVRNVSPREVQEPVIPAATRTIQDAEYTCDYCGQIELLVQEADERNGYYTLPWAPAGWLRISFDGHLARLGWGSRLDFCSRACEEGWLADGRWRRIIEAKREREGE